MNNQIESKSSLNDKRVIILGGSTGIGFATAKAAAAEGKFDHLVYTAAENLNLYNINQTDIEAARKFFNLRYWGAYAAVKYGTPFINEGGSVNLTGGTAGTRPAAG